jgi:hypothetical protein
MAMDRAEFEAELWREGYELREGEIKPNVHRGSHAHESLRGLAGRRELFAPTLGTQTTHTSS